jgi:GNAT superfamily N-acetyltransferase
MVTEIRNARRGDAQAIAAVHVGSWQVAYQGLLPGGVLASLSVPDRERTWSKIFIDPPLRSAVLLATSNAIVLGFAAVGADQDCAAVSEVGQLYAIYLRPDQWGRGIGTQLHHAAMGRLSGLGFTRARVWVLEGNERAIRFYLRHGWVADGARRIDQGPQGVDLPELRLCRPLPAV